MVDLTDEAYECAKNPKWVSRIFKDRLQNTLGSANRFVIYQEFKRVYKEHSKIIDEIYKSFT